MEPCLKYNQENCKKEHIRTKIRRSIQKAYLHFIDYIEKEKLEDLPKRGFNFEIERIDEILSEEEILKNHTKLT